MMPEARVAPPLTPAEASRIARDLYGLAATARALPGEYDDNFQLRSSDARSFVLKVMHPVREESFVDLQCRALLHLAASAPHLALPRVIPVARHQLFRRTALDDGSSRVVWLLTFLPGGALAEAKPRSPELLASLGSLLAEIDTALLGFSHPATERPLKWDLSGSLWARDYLGHIPDPRRRDLAARFLNLFESDALPRFRDLRRGVIYGDANDHNVLVSPPWPLPRRAISVIDFGDMHTGFIVAEPAVAAAYAILGQENPLSLAAALLSAYHRKFALSQDEI